MGGVSGTCDAARTIQTPHPTTRAHTLIHTPPTTVTMSADGEKQLKTARKALDSARSSWFRKNEKLFEGAEELRQAGKPPESKSWVGG